MTRNIPEPDMLMGLLHDPIAVARLDPAREIAFDIAPSAEIRRQIAETLGLVALRKFRLSGTLRALGRSDWELRGDLGATVVQECGTTLAPVTTRIDEPVIRRYLAHLPEPEGTEVEMPADDTLEPLEREIDPGRVAFEALSLALPQFPRAPDAINDHDAAGPADVTVLRAAPPGDTPLDDEDVKPFAGLRSLRDKLGNPGESGHH